MKLKCLRRSRAYDTSLNVSSGPKVKENKYSVSVSQEETPLIHPLLILAIDSLRLIYSEEDKQFCSIYIIQCNFTEENAYRQKDK